ncbi:MAG TPA: hypothetical protein VL172_10750 [Kofleriaceae bacterium]|nr:hypothetical protein [Kofleriaceae bacterium]
MIGVFRASAVVLAALAWGAPAAANAAAAESKATFTVDVVGDGVPAWEVDALRQALVADTAGPRLSAVDGAGADLILGGTIEPGRWRYQVRMTWPGAGPPLHGVIALDGIGRHGLREAVAGALEPVMRSGGLLDLRDHPVVEAEAARLPAPAGGAGALALAALALWLLAPFAVALLLGVGVRSLRSLRRALACCGLLAVAAVVLLAAPQAVPPAWVILVGGGLAWGWFAAVLLPHVLPPLHGFGSIEHGDLLRMLGSWVALALQRAARAALLLAPLALVTWAAWALLDLPAIVAVAVVAPIVGLLGRLWLHAWVEILAARLDAALVDGSGTEEDPWHGAVRGYLLGYLRRAGWTGDAHSLDGIRFLPGAGDAVHLYGGGLTHTRVILGRELLEYALAPYGRPHDYAAPRVSNLHWTEWNAGLVVPVEVGAILATREQRQPRQVAIAGDEQEYQPLGEPPTLVGTVEPYKLDKRAAHRPWEDPLWLDWDPGDEADGTDASDKDFLFGLLALQLGRIRRHEDRAATVALAARRALAARPRAERAARKLGAPGRVLLDRQPAVIADAYAALNFARHHLAQYLAWQVWRREDLLTARAHAPELERESRAILAALEAEKAREPRTAGATPRRRLIWLSGFLSERLRSRGARLWRRAVVAGVLVGGLVAAGLAVKQAVDYHPVWLERMKEQRARLQPADDERQQPDGKED